jgi:FADH2 O2-dependent halogenase
MDFDIAIVGSGFAGSLTAMVARQLGYSVVLLESGKHPRFAIGESTSPLTNLLLEQIAERYALPRLLPLTQWGTWQKSYPHLSVGLKRGFTYYAQTAGTVYQPDAERRNELLVAASPHDFGADTHWYRPDVDTFFVQEAVALGVEYWDETRIRDVAFVSGAKDGTTEAVLQAERAGQKRTIRARFVIDASGTRGFLFRALRLAEGKLPCYPQTATLFSHFTGVARTDQMGMYTHAGSDTPPYRPDDSALHHVFHGGWMWVLRFNNGITSAGCAVEKWLADELNLEGNEAAWNRFLARFPSVQEQFAHAQAVEPFRYGEQLSWRVESKHDVWGPGWICLPSACAFVDPLYSTGFPLTLLGIERLAQILEFGLASPDRDAHLQEYARTTLAEADWVSRFIAGNYRAFGTFNQAFVPLSQFYFAAASYSEMARRLHKPHLLRGYLTPNHDGFLQAMGQCANDSPHLSFEQVFRAIVPVNVAGLADPQKRNWYNVNLSDLVPSAPKLELTPERMQEIIASAPWAR